MNTPLGGSGAGVGSGAQKIVVVSAARAATSGKLAAGGWARSPPRWTCDGMYGRLA